MICICVDLEIFYKQNVFLLVQQKSFHDTIQMIRYKKTKRMTSGNVYSELIGTKCTQKYTMLNISSADGVIMFFNELKRRKRIGRGLASQSQMNRTRGSSFFALPILL